MFSQMLVTIFPVGEESLHVLNALKQAEGIYASLFQLGNIFVQTGIVWVNSSGESSSKHSPLSSAMIVVNFGKSIFFYKIFMVQEKLFTIISGK